MVRTRNQVRGAKSKGSQFEHSVYDSLIVKYPDLVLTKELGFVRQFDILSRKDLVAIECKFHKSLTWNECKGYFLKLKEKTQYCNKHFLIYKTNHQPVLVMYDDGFGITIKKFEDYFNLPFIVHNKKKEEKCPTKQE